MGHSGDSYDNTIILTERQTAVLQALVEEYIASAQPISSSALSNRAEIMTSSATVRNDLARLEELGLVYQPHTSAGRIPTDLGYRYYVDHLITQFHRQPQALMPLLSPSDPGVESTCRLLGELTRYTTLALVPGWQEHRLQHIELAPVGPDQLLVMLVTDNHQVLHSLSVVTDRPTPARLRQLNDLLNSEFRGKLLAEMTEEALTTAVNKLPPSEFFRLAAELVRRGLEENHPSARMYVEGTTHIFEQQDFTDVPRLRALMEALHEESAFEKLFSRTQPGQIEVSIGTENLHPGLQDCAVVFTSYHLSQHTTGRVGVLGPKRMKYRQVIGTMDAIVQNLDQRYNNPSRER